MSTKEQQGIITISIGGLLLIGSLIGSVIFAERLEYGGYIFTAASLAGLVLLFLGMRKIIQHTLTKR